jgi:hypothetical protein
VISESLQNFYKNIFKILPETSYKTPTHHNM